MKKQLQTDFYHHNIVYIQSSITLDSKLLHYSSHTGLFNCARSSTTKLHVARTSSDLHLMNFHRLTAYRCPACWVKCKNQSTYIRPSN